MKNKFFISIITLVTFLLIGCDGSQTEAKDNKENSDKKESVLTVPVEVMTVTKKPVARKVSYTGIISANKSVDIIAEVSGKIEKINKKLGDWVKKNESLAQIDSRIPEANLRQAEAQVLSAENNLSIAKTNFESDKELFKNGDISKIALENSELTVKTAEANLMTAKAQLKITQKAFEDAKLFSPIQGFVSRKNVELGTMVNIGSPVFRIVDLSTLKVKLGVPQDIVGNINNSSKAKIEISSLNNKVYDGNVKYVSPQADELTGTFEVEIHINNSVGFDIKAGMTAKVNLILSAEENRLVVPDYTVTTRDSKSFIYKVRDGRALLTEVKLGQNYGSSIEILEGLEPGEVIVSVGIKNLGINTKIKVEN